MFCKKKLFFFNPNNQLVYSNTACFKYWIYSKYSQIPHGAPPPQKLYKTKTKENWWLREEKKKSRRKVYVHTIISEKVYVHVWVKNRVYDSPVLQGWSLKEALCHHVFRSCWRSQVDIREWPIIIWVLKIHPLSSPPPNKKSQLRWMDITQMSLDEFEETSTAKPYVFLLVMWS